MNRRKFLIASSVIAGGLASGAIYWQGRWDYIVIHHSAGDFGNIEFLQKVHKERQANDPIDAIPYHYIIGNGHGLAEGEIASDWRQQYNIWGAHVSARNSQRNFKGIGICLIGNLENKAILPKQYAALVALTKKLMLKHAIPLQNVTGHGYTPGESTKCPGKHFPMEKFLKEISA